MFEVVLSMVNVINYTKSEHKGVSSMFEVSVLFEGIKYNSDVIAAFCYEMPDSVVLAIKNAGDVSIKRCSVQVGVKAHDDFTVNVSMLQVKVDFPGYIEFSDEQWDEVHGELYRQVLSDLNMSVESITILLFHGRNYRLVISG